MTHLLIDFFLVKQKEGDHPFVKEDAVVCVVVEILRFLLCFEADYFGFLFAVMGWGRRCGWRR